MEDVVWWVKKSTETCGQDAIGTQYQHNIMTRSTTGNEMEEVLVTMTWCNKFLAKNPPTPQRQKIP